MDDILRKAKRKISLWRLQAGSMAFTRNGKNLILPVLAATYILYQLRGVLVYSEHQLIPMGTIETTQMECSTIFAGDTELRKLKTWNHHFSLIEANLYESIHVCASLHQYFYFEPEPLTDEEAEFPLAFGINVNDSLVQVLLQLSIIYQPQNTYVLVVDSRAKPEFKNFLMAVPKCYANVKVMMGKETSYGSMGIVENVFEGFKYLTTLKHPWKYYQHLTGYDLPLKTNFEMVRILKTLNGSINTDVENYDISNTKNLIRADPPMNLFKSQMSAVIPRKAADFIVNNTKVVKELMNFLSETENPEESFWTTLLASPKDFPVPGSFSAADILWLRSHMTHMRNEMQSVYSIGSSYIGRYQVYDWQGECGGTFEHWTCFFGVKDIKELVLRPELIAHKFDLLLQPAGFMCLLKEIRRRSHMPSNFDASSYGQMPSVELHGGRMITELTHPEWVQRSSYHR